MSSYASTPLPWPGVWGGPLKAYFPFTTTPFLSITSVLTVKTCLPLHGWQFKKSCTRGVVSFTVRGRGQELHFLHLFSNFHIFFLFFLKVSKFAHFFLILTLWMGVIGPPGKALATLLSCTLQSYQYYVDCIRRKIIQFSLKLLVKNY